MSAWTGGRRISFRHTLSMAIDTAKFSGATDAEIREQVAATLAEVLPAAVCTDPECVDHDPAARGGRVL